MRREKRTKEREEKKQIGHRGAVWPFHLIYLP
jgi:hypothetical protein